MYQMYQKVTFFVVVNLICLLKNWLISTFHIEMFKFKKFRTKFRTILIIKQL